MSILRRALTHLNVQVELVACSRQISTLPTVCRWHQDKVENRNLRRFGYKDYVSRHYILRNWQQVWAHFRINTMITYISVFRHILKYDKIRLGTRLECRVRDHRPAGWPKNLKAEYTTKPYIHQGRITWNIRKMSLWKVSLWKKTWCRRILLYLCVTLIILSR